MSNIDEQFTINLAEGVDDILDSKSKSALVFMSKLYEKDGEDRLAHRLIMAKDFKKDDIIICLENYRDLIVESLDAMKNNATEVLEKIKGLDIKKDDKDA